MKSTGPNLCDRGPRRAVYVTFGLWTVLLFWYDKLNGLGRGKMYVVHYQKFEMGNIWIGGNAGIQKYWIFQQENLINFTTDDGPASTTLISMQPFRD